MINKFMSKLNQTKLFKLIGIATIFSLISIGFFLLQLRKQNHSISGKVTQISSTQITISDGRHRPTTILIDSQTKFQHDETNTNNTIQTDDFIHAFGDFTTPETFNATHVRKLKK